MKNYRLWLGISSLLVLLVIVLGFMALLYKSKAESGDITIQGSKFSLKMGMKNHQLSFEEIVVQVFTDHDKAVEAKALMAEKYALFAIDDAELETAISRLSPQAKLAERLREMATKHKGPWKRELVKVRLSFPPNLDVAEDSCVVCDGSDWLNRRLILWDKSETFSSKVVAGNTRACQAQETESLTGPENIQITVSTARRLFGSRPLNKFEDGWVGFAD